MDFNNFKEEEDTVKDENKNTNEVSNEISNNNNTFSRDMTSKPFTNHLNKKNDLIGNILNRDSVNASIDTNMTDFSSIQLKKKVSSNKNVSNYEKQNENTNNQKTHKHTNSKINPFDEIDNTLTAKTSNNTYKNLKSQEQLPSNSQEVNLYSNKSINNQNSNFELDIITSQSSTTSNPNNAAANNFFPTEPNTTKSNSKLSLTVKNLYNKFHVSKTERPQIKKHLLNDNNTIRVNTDPTSGRNYSLTDHDNCVTLQNNDTAHVHPEDIMFLKYSEKRIASFSDDIKIKRNKMIIKNYIIIILALLSFSNVLFYSARNMIYIDIVIFICSFISLYALITIKNVYMIINLIIVFPVLLFCYTEILVDYFWYDEQKSNYNRNHKNSDDGSKLSYFTFICNWFPFVFYGIFQSSLYYFLNSLYDKKNLVVGRKQYIFLHQNDSMLKKTSSNSVVVHKSNMMSHISERSENKSKIDKVSEKYTKEISNSDSICTETKEDKFSS